MDGVTSVVNLARSADGGGLFCGCFGSTCRQYWINQLISNAKSLELNGVAEGALYTIQNSALAARIQAPIIFPHVEYPPSEALWAEAVNLACADFNRTKTSSNLGNKSPHATPRLRPTWATGHRMRCGMMRLLHLHHRNPFFVLGIAAGTASRRHCLGSRIRSNSGPGIEHTCDSLRMLTRAKRR